MPAANGLKLSIIKMKMRRGCWGGRGAPRKSISYRCASN